MFNVYVVLALVSLHVVLLSCKYFYLYNLIFISLFDCRPTTVRQLHIKITENQMGKNYALAKNS